jgi:cytochrome c peroxidase
MLAPMASVGSSLQQVAGAALGCALLAACDGGGFAAQCREDLALTDVECAAIAAWRLPSALPPARGNAYADDLRAAELGRAIFFDTGFSAVPDVSCASCHAPERAYQDGMAVSEVIAGSPGARNSPTLYNVAWNEGFFLWDGAADSLWSQPLFALENEIEMGTTRLAIAHRMHEVATYREAYEAIFGALPPLSDTARFPADGKPGDPSWEAMTVEDRALVNRVAANVGKALEAYMRRIATGPSAVDRYIDGDRDALSPEARRGLARFVRSGCARCHSGPTLADDLFHPANRDTTDRGRAAGIEILLASPFSSAGELYDEGTRPPLVLPTGPSAEDEHAFRTPSMRNVARTAPYRHDGSATLEEILIAPSLFYEEGDEVVIAEFLRALDGELPPAEWTTPP